MYEDTNPLASSSERGCHETSTAVGDILDTVTLGAKVGAIEDTLCEDVESQLKLYSNLVVR